MPQDPPSARRRRRRSSQPGRQQSETAVRATEPVADLRRRGIGDPPLPVDDKGVIVHALLERNRDRPDARCGLVQVVARLPIREGSRKLDSGRRGVQAELHEQLRIVDGSRQLRHARGRLANVDEQDDRHTAGRGQRVGGANRKLARRPEHLHHASGPAGAPLGRQRGRVRDPAHDCRGEVGRPPGRQEFARVVNGSVYLIAHNKAYRRRRVRRPSGHIMPCHVTWARGASSTSPKAASGSEPPVAGVPQGDTGMTLTLESARLPLLVVTFAASVLTVGCGGGNVLQSPTGPSATANSETFATSSVAGGASSASSGDVFDTLDKGGNPGGKKPRDAGEAEHGKEPGEAGDHGRGHDDRVVGFVSAKFANTLTVNGVTVAGGPGVVIRHGNRTLTMADIQVGDHVQARGTMDGTTLVATEIKVEDTGNDNDGNEN